MIPILFVIAILVGLVIGYTIVSRRGRTRYLASTEYWVYIPGEKMPPQEQLLDQVVGQNPYKKAGRSPVGPAEGLVLSDIRLHIALVLRRKNSHVFRPDLFEEIVVTEDHMKALAASNAMVKLRYISEEPLKDKRHLQFLIHAADAMATIADSKLIYDSTARRLITKEELEAILRKEVDATRPDAHVSVTWKDRPSECFAETHGLRKIGLDELRTGPMEADEKVLVLYVMDLAIERLWGMAYLPQEVEVEAYGDTFKLLLSEPKDGYALTRILRVQLA